MRRSAIIKEVVTVINFQATKIEMVIAQRIINNNIKIIASSLSDYAGYIDGEFLDEEALSDSIAIAKQRVEEIYGKKIKSVYIGVPAEFCNYALKNLKASYPNKIVIKDKNIQDLFESVGDHELSDDYLVVSKSPIYYVLDSVQTMEPQYSLSKNMGVKASLILAKNSFVNLMNNILGNLGVNSIEFVPNILAVGMSLLDESVRRMGSIIIDFDYVSTSVYSIMGEGIVDLKTFAIGEGHIISDLCEVLKLNYFNVEKLKNQIILTLQSNPMDNYEIKDENNNLIKINSSLANEVVKARIDMIGETIDKILLNFQFKQEDGPIYITGSGLTYLKGIKNYLSSVLHRECEILAPKQVEYNNPKYARMVSLINFIISQNKN